MIKYRKLYSYYLVPTIVARKSDSKGTMMVNAFLGAYVYM